MSRWYTLKKDKKRRFLSSKSEKQRRKLQLKFFNTYNFRKRFLITRRLARCTPNQSFSRVQNRCLLTNSARAVYRRFHLNRHAIKKLGNNKQIAGLYRRI